MPEHHDYGRNAIERLRGKRRSSAPAPPPRKAAAAPAIEIEEETPDVPAPDPKTVRKKTARKTAPKASSDR